MLVPVPERYDASVYIISVGSNQEDLALSGRILEWNLHEEKVALHAPIQPYSQHAPFTPVTLRRTFTMTMEVSADVAALNNGSCWGHMHACNPRVCDDDSDGRYKNELVSGPYGLCAIHGIMYGVTA